MGFDIQAFCATELDPRDYLRSPWKAGEWVYATNGHIAVRVPARDYPQCRENAAAPAAPELFAKAFNNTGDFLLMPRIPAMPKCFECEGTGKVRAIKCPDCDADTPGEFLRGTFTYLCQNCGDSPAGEGWQHLPDDEYGPQPHEVQRICHECEGHGFIIANSTPSIVIGGAGYHPAYLAMLASLPQVRIRPGEPATKPDGSQWFTPLPAAVIFDGGQALLMPRRD